MAIALRLHSVESGKVPGIAALRYKTAEAIVIGSVVVNGTAGDAGTLVVAGANPTDIVGVALQAADTNPGFSAANSPTVITGRNQTVSVVRPNDATIFEGTLTNGSSATVVPAQADVLAQYGITAYSGVWTVDKAKTGANARVEVVGIDTTQNVVFFKFLESAISNQ